MHEGPLIELALKTLSCNQKQLAVQLGVSGTQISKWKNGEHMSFEVEQKLRRMTNIGDKEPAMVLWAGSCEEVEKWENLVRFLANAANEAEETGYDTHPLEDDLGLLCWQTLTVLMEIGVDLPRQVPREIDFDYEIINNENTDDEESEELFITLIEENPYSKLIYKLYLILNDVYGFYAAYIDDLIGDDDLDLMSTEACNIEPCLMDLAACKLKDDVKLMPNLANFRYRVLGDFEKWINIVKDKAFRAGVPLRAELMKLVTRSHDELGHEAEAQSLGFNSIRIHPDIYMNEILYRLRIIDQVIPVILKKLEIDFKIDGTKIFDK